MVKSTRTPVISAEDLTGGYGHRAIVKNCYLSVEEGEFVSIIGPNGSGKTTLVRLLLGLLVPFSGKVFFRGKLLSQIPRSDLARQVAFLPSSVETTFGYKVKEFVALGYLPFSLPWQQSPEEEKIVQESLNLVDAASLAESSVREISEGEKQRVFLAQTLAQKPELLVLDEPTSHLDIGHQCSVMNLLWRLNRRQKVTIICVLHDLNLASDYCDRLVLLKEGRIFSAGCPSEVLRPEIIESVYQTKVLLSVNPATGRPHLFGKPEENFP